jgi:hypothetical protein
MAQTYAGPISTLGITPSFINTLAQQAASTATTSAINQVYQGAGASFLGSAGQTLVGNLAGSAVNVAMNAALGTQIAGPGGVSASSGRNLLASAITPYVNTVTAAGINQAINNSLQNAGPFAGVLSGVATGLVSQVANNLLGGAFFNGAGGGFGSSYKTFPGGSDADPSANYDGKAYTLGLNGSDVVFSLQPANQGPQAFGLAQGISFPTSIPTLPFNQLVSMPPLVPNATANALKNAAMSDKVGKKAFSSNLSSNFNTSLSLL